MKQILLADEEIQRLVDALESDSKIVATSDLYPDRLPYSVLTHLNKSEALIKKLKDLLGAQHETTV